MTVRDDRADGVHTAGTMAATPQGALDRLYSAAYEELRRLAATLLRGNAPSTLSPTGLVNEVYLKLVRSGVPAGASADDVKHIAVNAMRQVLCDAARARHAAKRGGPNVVFVTLSAAVDAAASDGAVSADEFLALDAALRRFEQLDPRKARLVRHRFYEGDDVAAAAARPGISVSAAERDWRAARAWLAAEVRRSATAPDGTGVDDTAPPRGGR
ncbi:MAG TPA: ECF-type sigma factor [Gemmatirosa sp.]